MQGHSGTRHLPNDIVYDQSFYSDRRTRTLQAARTILGALPASIARRSVADIGCGTGTWLAAALETGSSEAIGIEGDWVSPEMLDDPRIAFHPRDLEQVLPPLKVDLALSLEVAEHLSPARAGSFVAELAAMAPAVLFSAAIPGQGGVGHRNEQWQSYWAEKFERSGMAAFDVIRPAIWTDSSIPAWYRQNTILYLDAELAAASGLIPTRIGLLDRVHPEFWNRANRELDYAGALPESVYLDLSRR
jgi:SAM-dependent methyltransferase